MVAVPLGLNSYRRRGERNPEISLLNILLEKDPTNQVDGLVRYQRPALTPFAVVGTGPIRGVFRRQGVLGSLYLIISRSTLYKINASSAGIIVGAVGAIPGSDLVSIDGQSDRAIIVANGTAYSTDGSTITPVNMPGGVSVSSVTWIAGYFILTQAVSQRLFWLAPGDVDPDPLNFTSAENAPDNIVCGIRLLDELWVFGEQTTEVFQVTGNIDAPFMPIGGRLYERGCANKDTVYALDNTLFWVGNDLIAYRADTTPIRISDHSLEERLRNAGPNDLRAWAFELDGHTIYVVRAGAIGTWANDIENPTWSQFKSYGFETWRAHIGTQVSGDLVIAGDDSQGIVWRLDTTVSNDNGVQIEREVTGGLTVIGAPVPCKDFSVRVAVGWAPITGSAVDPLLQLRFSDDGGNTWSSWIEASLGRQGQYLTEVVWRQLGILAAPGRIFTVRMTDDALFRISFARVNEAVSI